jgi:pimeloyl-ACP methyl ester carboxylesterase
VHHDRRGEGTPIVLIHGLGGRRQVWRPIIDILAAHHEVITLDLPGFGETPPDTSPGSEPRAADRDPDSASNPGSVPYLADRVASFLAEQRIDRPAIGGSSLGGAIALELGRRGIARAVTAFAPVGFFGSAGALWCRTAITGARMTARLLRPALPALMAAPVGRKVLCGLFYARPGSLIAAECVADAYGLIDAMGFGPARRAIGTWRVPAVPTEPTSVNPGIPVTVAWGTRDRILPYHPQAARARSRLPHARHVRLSGCGHLPFGDDPETCARLILETA